MGIIESFSKMKKKMEKEKAGIKDVYQYDNLPQEFRVQVIFIWKEAIGENNKEDWQLLHDSLARELGRFSLSDDSWDTSSDFSKCAKFLIDAETDGALDIIQLSFQIIDCLARHYDNEKKYFAHIKESADGAIEELNARFKEHCIGYEFVNSQLIRIDSEYLHDEVVKKAIKLLCNNNFDGALDEFSKAHENYRNGKYKESIAESLKAFESTIKSICELKEWEFDAEKDTASKLIEIIFNKGLIPEYLKQQFTSLKSCLTSGVPTVRNKTSGHGQGQTIKEVPDYFAAYALHLTATNIVFLVEAFKFSNKDKQ